MVKILVQGFCGEFDLPRFSGWLAARVRPKVSGSELVSSVLSSSSTMHQPWVRHGRKLTGNRPRLARQLTQLLDGNNARAHPASRDIAQARPDKFP
jgi:hypothetical protein